MSESERIVKYKKAYDLLNCSDTPVYFLQAPDSQSIPFVVYSVEREFFNADNKNYSSKYIVTAEAYRFDTDNSYVDALEESLGDIPFEVEEDYERSEHITVTTYRFEV